MTGPVSSKSTWKPAFSSVAATFFTSWIRPAAVVVSPDGATASKASSDALLGVGESASPFCFKRTTRLRRSCNACEAASPIVSSSSSFFAGSA